MKKFYKISSKFRRTLDIINDLLDKFLILNGIAIALVIILPTLVLFYSLPNDIRTIVSSAFGGVLTLVVIPLAINHINRIQENKRHNFNTNKELYCELSDIIITILTENRSNEIGEKELLLYLHNYYSKMCLFFNSRLIQDIICLIEEFNLNGNNINYYCEKILKKIRKEGNVSGQFYISKKAISYMNKEV